WWERKPIGRRASGFEGPSRAPNTRTSPELGRASPASTLRSVVLPAPLGPATTSASPARTRTSRPRSTRSAPNARSRPTASRIAPSEDGIDGCGELVETEGFEDVTGVGKIQHFELGLDAHVGGRDDDRQVRLRVPDAAEENHPVRGRGAPVED